MMHITSIQCLFLDLELNLELHFPEENKFIGEYICYLNQEGFAMVAWN